MAKKNELTAEASIRKKLEDMSDDELLNPERLLRWGSFKKIGNNSIFFMARGSRGSQVKVKVTFYTEKIVRIQATYGKDFKETYSLVKANLGEIKIHLKRTKDRTSIICGGTMVSVEREPWRISLLKGNDFILCREQVFATNQAGEYISLVMGKGKRKNDGLVCVNESFEIHPEEGIFGFGERFDRLDKRGTVITTLVQAPLASNPQVSYKPAPFFFSSRGYGIYAHTLEPVIFDLGARSYEAISFTHPGNSLDYFLIVGNTPAEIIHGYHYITGLPEIPPEWSFGYMQSSASYRRIKGAEQFGYMTDKETLAVARRLRSEQIPCDGITFDTSWSGNYGPSPEKVYDWKFCLKRFPNPKKMAEKMRSMGFRLCVTQWPYAKKCFPDFAELKRKGFLVKNSRGRPNYGGWCYFIDLTNPEAYEWLKKKNRAICELGISALMADFGEDYPLDGVYYSGIQGRQARNLMPLLYQKALYEVTQEIVPGRGFLWARAGFAGMQLTPGHWAGDNHSSFQSLAGLIRAGLNFGISGGVFWGHDIGGWFGQCNFKPDGTQSGWTDPSEGLFIRWSQFGFFSTWLRSHGGTPREPWAFGRRALNIFRHYAQFRSRLIPYIYSCALEARETGMPIMRAMFFEFPNDPTCWRLEQQYMFGPTLLVAPVCEEGNKVQVYLPEGKWQDIWSKKIYTGPVWLNYHAPLEIIPVFQRGDTILPLGPVRQHVGERIAEPLELWAFVQKKAEFRMRNDKRDITFTAAPKGRKLTFKSTGNYPYKLIKR